MTSFAEMSTNFTELDYQRIVNPKGVLNFDSWYCLTRDIPAVQVSEAVKGTREFFFNDKGKWVLQLTHSVSKALKIIRPLSKAMTFLKLIYTVGDVVTASTQKTKRRAYLKASAALLAGGLGAIAGGVFGFGAGAFPVALGATNAAIMFRDSLYLGTDILGKEDEFDTAIENSFNAVSSLSIKTGIQAVETGRNLVETGVKVVNETIKTAIKTVSHAIGWGINKMKSLFNW